MLKVIIQLYVSNVTISLVNSSAYPLPCLHYYHTIPSPHLSYYHTVPSPSSRLLPHRTLSLVSATTTLSCHHVHMPLVIHKFDYSHQRSSSLDGFSSCTS